MRTNELPTYIPLEEAARQYHLPPAALTVAVKAGIVRAIQAPTGIMVAEMDIQNLKEHPTYVSLDEAVQRYRISAKALLKAIEDGSVKAVKMREGTSTVLAVEIKSVQEFAKQFQQNPSPFEKKSDLISINEAARRLNLNPGIVYNWYKRGYLLPQGRGKNRIIFISFRQAQALAKLRQRQGNRRGRRLIPKDTDIAQVLASQDAP